MEFKHVDQATMLPGVCLLCASGSGGFVDTGRSRPGTGQIYLCVRCVAEITAVYDVVPKVAFEKQRAELRELRRAVKDAEEARETALHAAATVEKNVAGLQNKVEGLDSLRVALERKVQELLAELERARSGQPTREDIAAVLGGAAA